MAQEVWNQQMETLSRDELESLRLEKLRRQLKYCYRNSLFYRKKFTEVGARPEDIKTWEDFRRLPVFMTKEVERESQRESRERIGHPFGMHLCVPRERIIAIGTTAGTTGLPTVSYAFTPRDLKRWNEAMARMCYLAGLRPKDRIINCFPMSGGYAGALMADSFRYMGVTAFNLGIEPGVERVLQLARLFNPNALTTSPSFAELIVENCKRVIGVEAREIGIKTLIFGGEPGIGLPAIRSKVEEAFNARWHDYLGGNAEGFCASCDAKEYQGMHEVAPDLSISVEDLVDPVTKKPVEVKDGAIGEAVVTSLDREGSPYVKYAAGDVFQVFTKPCPCGYPGPGYRKRIMGSVEDMLIVNNTVVFPLAVKESVSSFYPRVTGAMRIVLTQKPPRISPPLKIKVEYGAGVEGQLDNLRDEIERKLKDKFNIPLEIQFLPPQTLERVAFKTPILEKAY